MPLNSDCMLETNGKSLFPGIMNLTRSSPFPILIQSSCTEAGWAILRLLENLLQGKFDGTLLGPTSEAEMQEGRVRCVVTVSQQPSVASCHDPLTQVGVVVVR